MNSQPLDDFRIFPWLNSNECQNLVAQVVSNRSSWIRRGQTSGLYSLGEATYRDQQLADQDFSANNRLLKTLFGDFLNRLTRQIENILGEKVKLSQAWPLPGFHIFTYYPFGYEEGLGPHFDQYWLRSTQYKNNELLSVTVPLLLQAPRPGLTIWPIQHVHGEITPPWSVDLLTKTVPLYLPYSLGAMVLHSGAWLHAVSAEALPENMQEMRITCQGHLRRQNGEWELFW